MGLFDKFTKAIRDSERNSIDLEAMVARAEEKFGGLNRKRVYLVDYENVNESGLKGIGDLKEIDEVYIFSNEQNKTMAFDRSMELTRSKAKIEFTQLHKSGKNYLDFQLSTFLGYLIGKNSDCAFYIISKDTGYDSVDDFWKDRNIEIYRRDNIAGEIFTEKVGKRKNKTNQKNRKDNSSDLKQKTDLKPKPDQKAEQKKHSDDKNHSSNDKNHGSNDKNHGSNDKKKSEEKLQDSGMKTEKKDGEQKKKTAQKQKNHQKNQQKDQQKKNPDNNQKPTADDAPKTATQTVEAPSEGIDLQSNELQSKSNDLQPEFQNTVEAKAWPDTTSLTEETIQPASTNLEESATKADTVSTTDAEKVKVEKTDTKKTNNRNTKAKKVKAEGTVEENEKADNKKKSLPESVRKEIRSAVKDMELSPPKYTAIYKAFLECEDKLSFNNALVKSMQSDKGGQVYGQLKNIFEKYRKTID